jgi:hypothetical protein
MSEERKFKAHPRSALGDFYAEDGQCMACGVPHVLAPELMDWTEEKYWHCFWKRQPETPKELDKAIAVLHSQELGCHRYAGTDPGILLRLPRECCDHFSPQPFVPAKFSSDGSPFRFALMESKSSLGQRLWRKIFRGDNR